MLFRAVLSSLAPAVVCRAKKRCAVAILAAAFVVISAGTGVAQTATGTEPTTLPVSGSLPTTAGVMASGLGFQCSQQCAQTAGSAGSTNTSAATGCAYDCQAEFPSPGGTPYGTAIAPPPGTSIGTNGITCTGTSLSTQCSSGVRQNKNAINILYDNYPTLCRFVDNTSGNDLFVPQNTQTEFADFVTHAPSGVAFGYCTLGEAYTIDRSHRLFQVDVSGTGPEEVLQHLYRYVATYQRQRGVKALEEARQYINRPHNDFVLAVAHQITQFVYDVVERGRRQALAEMLRICEKARDGEDLRQPILDYLGRSKYAEQIDKAIQDSENAGIQDVASIVQGVSSVMDAAELLGECARLLEAYPDQPSLRLLRAAAEAMTPHPDESIVMQNVEAAMRDGISNYGLSLTDILDVVVISADVISESRPEIAKLFLQSAALAAPDRRLAARHLLQQVSEVRHHLLGPPLALLVRTLVESVRSMKES